MSAAVRSTFAQQTPGEVSHAHLMSDVRSLFPHRIEDLPLIRLQDHFIEAWAKMATSFAMDRTLGRVHAIIYISIEPIDVDAIAMRLALSRESSELLVKELLSWGLIRAVDDGSGVARYSAEQDPWSWFLRTVRERHQREFLPLQRSVRQVLEQARALSQSTPALRTTLERVERFSRFIDEVMRFIDAFVNLGAKPMAAVLKTVAKLMPRSRSF
jgi:DNA-binding transcriptional regulator GbsR (MarR family)